MAESLRKLLADLHEERVRTWPPEDLDANIWQRRALVESFDPKSTVQPGDVLDDFTLLDVDGPRLSLSDLIAEGPAVLIFFRFAGCPACNIALPYYQRALWPQLNQEGVRLIAVSPQLPERLAQIKAAHGLGFTVASDPGNALGRRLGITFEGNATTRAYVARKGIDFPAIIGTGTWELPQPTAVVIDRRGTVRYIDVSPDWLLRTEAAPILDAVRALSPIPA